MANAKKIIADWSEVGKTVYCIIRREADGFLLNSADGTFAASPANTYLTLTENATIKGRYEVSESRTVWTDGRYTIAVYKQAGGSPAPASDTIISSGEMDIASDAEIYPDVFPSGIKTKTDTINWGDIGRLLGLSMENRVEDNITRDSGNRMTGSVLYCYNSATNATTHDKTTGLVYKYQTSFTYDASGNMTLDKITRLL